MSKKELMDDLGFLSSDSLLFKGSEKKDKETKDKKKKKKKGNFKTEMIINGDYCDPYDINDDAVKAENIPGLSDLLISRMDDDDDDEYDQLIKKEKKRYKNKGSDGNEYKKEFDKEFALLYNELDDMNIIYRDLMSKYKQLSSSKARGASRSLTELAKEIIACKAQKLSIIKEIDSLKAKCIDFKLKDARANSDKMDGDMDAVASTFFNQIMGVGRNNFVGSKPSGINSIMDSDLDEFEDALEAEMESRSGFRTEELDMYVKYEQLEPRIIVKREIDTGNWEFMAVDKDNQEIPEYPLPTKEGAGKMRFSDDGALATDKQGISYNIIEIMSGNDDIFDNEF